MYVFFKTKGSINSKDPLFKTLFLAFSNKNNERYFFTAQQGFFKQNKLFLQYGAIHTFQNGRYHVATFQTVAVDLQAFIGRNQLKESLTNLKYLTWQHLLAQKTESEAFIELHKRLAQALWVCALPVLALFLTQIITSKSFLTGLIATGGLYLLSYVLVALGQAYSGYSVLALLIFYMPILVLFFLGWYLYRRRYI